MAEVKLISTWKKRPLKYKLKADEVLAELRIQIKGVWQTRHLAIKNNDPILGGLK